MKKRRYTLNSSNRIRGNFFPSLLVIIFTLIDLIRLYNILPSSLVNMLYILIGIISIIYCIYINGFIKQKSILIFLFFYTLFGLIGVLFNRNIDFQEVLWPLAFLGVAMLILNFKLSNKLTFILFFSVVMLLITSILQLGIDNLSLTSSRNALSVMVLFYFSLHIINLYNNYSKITLLPVIIGLIASTLAIGRSGILTFLLLLFLFLLIESRKGVYKFKNPFKNVIFLSFLGFIIWYSAGFIEIYFPEALNNFRNRGLESVRNLIWKDYIIKTFENPIYLLFGTPISGTVLLDRYSENLHNSILMLHAKYGVMIFLSVIGLILNSLFSFISQRNFIYLILLIGIVFRMQFDYTNFNAQLDVIFFYIIFSPFYKNITDKDGFT